MFRTAALVLIASAGLLAGCQNSQTQAGARSTAAAPAGQVATVNSMCPIGRHEWTEGGTYYRPASLTRTWKDTTIGFCCQDCVDTWDADMTEADRDQIRALALKNEHRPW